MARPNWNLLRSLLARAVREPLGEIADAELLERFRITKDAAAFELLVRRYADVVFGVCRRVCRDEQDAEDAFQATFLVLARKAGSVKKNLAGWLYRTANRAAIRANSRRSRIQNREIALTIDPVATTPAELAELRAVLDAEIDRLPERLRLAVLHCYVEGRSTEDAAARLGVPRGTILSRLNKAREVLADRLTRRGITAPLTAATLTAALTGETASATLVATATSTVLLPVAGSAAELISLEVLRMTAWKTTTAWAAALILTAGLGTGTGIMMAQGEKPAPVMTAQSPPAAKPPSPEKRENDTPADSKEKRLNELEKSFQRAISEAKAIADARAWQRAQTQSKVDSITDPKVLQDGIAKIDAALLELEESEQGLLSKLAKSKAAVEAARVYAPTDEEIDTVVSRLSHEIISYIENARVLRNTINKMKENNLEGAAKEKINQLNKEYDDAMKKINDYKTANRDKAIPVIRAPKIKAARQDVSFFESKLSELKLQRQEKLTWRDTLTNRLQKRRNHEQSESGPDYREELNRRIIEELMRKIVILKTGGDPDSQSSKMERLEAEVAELRAEVRKLAEKKN